MSSHFIHGGNLHDVCNRMSVAFSGVATLIRWLLLDTWKVLLGVSCTHSEKEKAESMGPTFLLALQWVRAFGLNLEDTIKRGCDRPSETVQASGLPHLAQLLLCRLVPQSHAPEASAFGVQQRVEPAEKRRPTGFRLSSMCSPAIGSTSRTVPSLASVADAWVATSIGVPRS